MWPFIFHGHHDGVIDTSLDFFWNIFNFSGSAFFSMMIACCALAVCQFAC